MTGYNTHYQDQNRPAPLSDFERKIFALPSEWRERYNTIFLGQPQPPVVSQAQALLQVQSEMAMDEECHCFLPEQHCSKCSPACNPDVELPY